MPIDLNMIQILLLIAMIVCSSIAGMLRFKNYLIRILKKPKSLVKVADGKIDFQQLFHPELKEMIGSNSFKRLEAITTSQRDQILQEMLGNNLPDILIWFSLYTYVEHYQSGHHLEDINYIFKRRKKPIYDYPIKNDIYQQPYAIIKVTPNGKRTLTTQNELPEKYQSMLEFHENHSNVDN